MYFCRMNRSLDYARDDESFLFLSPQAGGGSEGLRGRVNSRHQCVRRRHDEDKELLAQLLKSNDQSGRAAVS